MVWGLDGLGHWGMCLLKYCLLAVVFIHSRRFDAITGFPTRIACPVHGEKNDAIS